MKQFLFLFTIFNFLNNSFYWFLSKLVLSAYIVLKSKSNVTNCNSYIREFKLTFSVFKKIYYIVGTAIQKTFKNIKSFFWLCFLNFVVYLTDTHISHRRFVIEVKQLLLSGPFNSTFFKTNNRYFWKDFLMTLFWSNHIITSCIKRKRITTNSTNPYFILAMFRTCFCSPFPTINDEKIKLQGLQ